MLSIQRLIDDIHSELKPDAGSGKVADYIPELAKVDSRKFGIAVETISGDSFFVGDAEEAFSIQSISKVFGLTLVSASREMRSGEGLDGSHPGEASIRSSNLRAKTASLEIHSSTPEPSSSAMRSLRDIARKKPSDRSCGLYVMSPKMRQLLSMPLLHVQSREQVFAMWPSPII
jgi:hypothetical protein